MEREIDTSNGIIGVVCVKYYSEFDSYYWSSNRYADNQFYKRIPKYLYDALNRFQDELEVKEADDE